MEVLLLLLAGIGLSHLLTDSSLANRVKDWAVGRAAHCPRLSRPVFYLVEMLDCYQCSGFWSGVVVFGCYYFGLWPLLWGFAISLLSPLWAEVKAKV